MTTFQVFYPKCACIVLDVAGVRPARDGTPAYHHVKAGLIEGIATLEEDDLVYVYRSDGDLVTGRFRGESVSVINDWHHRKVNVATAVEECIVLAGSYPNALRGVFYLTDNYKPIYDGLLRETLRREAKTDGNCRVFVYGIGPSYARTLQTLGDEVSTHYHFRHLDDYSGVAEAFREDLETL